MKKLSITKRESLRRKGRGSSMHSQGSEMSQDTLSGQPDVDYRSVPKNWLLYLTTMRAMSAMINVLQTQHQSGPMIPNKPFRTPPDNTLDDKKLSKVEIRIAEIEDKLKIISRKISECRTAQNILKERIQELEDSVYKSQELAILRNFMHTIPTEKDLLVLKKMKLIEAKRIEINREIRNKERESRILSKTLGRAEAIITETSLIKRPKRVVIVEEEPKVRYPSVSVSHYDASYVRSVDGVRGFKKVSYFEEEEEEEEEGNEKAKQGEENTDDQHTQQNIQGEKADNKKDENKQSDKPDQ